MKGRVAELAITLIALYLPERNWGRSHTPNESIYYKGRYRVPTSDRSLRQPTAPTSRDVDDEIAKQNSLASRTYSDKAGNRSPAI